MNEIKEANFNKGNFERANQHVYSELKLKILVSVY